LSSDRRAPRVGVIDALAYYTVEPDLPPGGWSRLQELTARARQTSEEMQREGIPVRFLRSIYVPEKEACFYLYEAASQQAVEEAARRAALPFKRVNKAIGPGSEEGRRMT